MSRSPIARRLIFRVLPAACRREAPTARRAHPPVLLASCLSCLSLCVSLWPDTGCF
jgi:hypothetical protein